MQKPDARPSAAAGDSKLHFLDYWRVIRVRFGIVLLTFLLVVITTGVVTYCMPKKYKAATTLEIRNPTQDATVFGGQHTNSGGGAPDASYIQTQFELVQSTDVLNPVIEQNDLERKAGWAVEGTPLTREQAYYKLRSMLSLKQVRGTLLMEVAVTSTVPEEAALLANAVAQSYSEVKRQSYAQLDVTSIGSLDTNLRQSQQQVSDLRTKVHQMLKDHPEIRDPDPENKLRQTDPFQEEVMAKRNEVDKAAVGVAALTNKLSQVSQLKPEELQRALRTLEITDPTVESILPKFQDADSNLPVLRNSGLGPNHPKIKALLAARDVYYKQLSEQIASIKHSLAIQLDIAKSTQASISQQLDNLLKLQSQHRTNSSDYDTLKEDYLKAKDVLTALEMQKQKSVVENGMTRTPAQQWNRAEKPSGPSSPRVPLNMAIGVLLGLVAGVGLAFFIEYLDTSVKTMEDVETMLGVPVLAIVPKNIKLLHKQPNDVPDAEAYRILRTNIEFNRKSADANTISLVSGGPGEGKSTTLANLAFTCAQGGYSVLIVDADLRRPTQHKIFETNNSIGLTNYLTTNIALEDVVLPTAVENLSIMPSGILPADAVGILNSQRMSDMIAELKTRYDIIFFDSPPILGVSDGAVLASEVDQSIIIVQ
ncbi:MAG: polysaccharide biosynthesis tyrosine autokinase, partial [Rhodospirillales bacterium]|nr:polysaccharide biosynthesis tyrosine autokinase [Acetobacter sp.]